MHGFPAAKTHRTIIQQLRLHRLKNSPLKKFQKAVQEALSASYYASGTTLAAPDRMSRASHRIPTSQTRCGGAAASQLLFQIPESLYTKAHGAFQMAVNRATNLLEAAAESASNSTAYLSNVTADADVYYRRMLRCIEERKRKYYSCIPFDARWDNIQHCLSALGRVSTGNTVRRFKNSSEAFEHMWAAVDNAMHDVLWQTYICKDDHVGKITVRKLEAAHERGCAVELMYDSGGNILGRSRLTEKLRQGGATVIEYKPFFGSALLYFFKGLDWRKSPGLRNHRKILLIDNKIGFCGGLNIGDDYCGAQWGGNGKFRDTHCSVYGPAVAHLREVYDDTQMPRPWKYRWTRWRQIASKRLNRRIEASKDAVKTNVLKPFQSKTHKVTERGGIYFCQQFRKAEEGTVRLLRRRWEKQHQQLCMWMTWYRKNVSPLLDFSGGCGGGITTRDTAGVETNSETHGARDGPFGVEGRGVRTVVNPLVSGKPPSELCVRNVAKPNPANETDFLENKKDKSGSGTVSKPLQSVAMQRKVAKERMHALSKATNMLYKRSYTNMLLQIPIADTHPVPEAAAYSSRRPVTTQIILSNPLHRDYSIQYAFWQVTRKCHRRIWITTPYYLPTRKLFRALLDAASRGVDVRILAGGNQTTDPWFMWHVSKYITERLLRGGVRIYEYKGLQIMHAKTVVADSVWSSIGSYNWDIMSNKNLEVCLCHMDAVLAREMEQDFLEDLAISEEIKLKNHRKRSVWLRFTSWLFYNAVFLMQRITFRSFEDEDVEDTPHISRD